MAVMLLLLMVSLVNLSTSDFLSSCPSLCTCKWSSGKQTADCSGKGLTTVPQDIHHDVQVRLDGNSSFEDKLLNLQEYKATLRDSLY